MTSRTRSVTRRGLLGAALLGVASACGGGAPAAPASPAAERVPLTPSTGVAEAATAGGPAAPAARLRVLFLGDNGHHQPSVRAKSLLPALAPNGIDVFYTDDVAALDPAELSKYHALLLYNNQPRISRAQLAALLGFVERGGGLAVLHSASASFQHSEEFIRLVGAAFKSHGTGTFRAERVAPDHPVVRGVPVVESWDETYVHTKHNPVDRTVLEVRREGGHEEPWTWVRTYGEGRVFYTAWGHDLRTWENEAFQQLVGQGLKWAAGDWAFDGVRPDPRHPVAELEMGLPIYAEPPEPWNTLEGMIDTMQVALSPEESLELMTLRPGFRVDLFATEPMIRNIIDFAWDERGRMWVVETVDYPNVVTPEGEPGNDRILILEDTNGDGRADEVKVFADGLNLPTSLAFANGGVVVGIAPDMIFLKDTTGDDRADVHEVLMSGFPYGDTHGTISNLRLGFDNQVWGSLGYNGFRGTVGGVTYEQGMVGAGYFRFPADGSAFDYVARTSNNTWGVAFTEDGYVFGSTANSRPTNFVHIPGRYYLDFAAPGRPPSPPILPGIADRLDVYPVRAIRQVDQFGRYTAGSGHELYTARLFPREYWNRVAFVTEPTAHLVGMFELEQEGSAFRATNRWSLAASRDAWAAPVQAKVGPDGAVWVSDFYTMVAQHNPHQPHFERGAGNAYVTPHRDNERARIYRIAPEDAPPGAMRSLEGASPAELVETLRDDNMFWRKTAQRLLVDRGETDVVPALVALLEDHTVDELGLNPHALHALWTLEGLGALDAEGAAREAVRLALHHPAASLRRAALEVLPRDARLADDIFAAGLLPDRSSPHGVDYTVPSATLQDADGQVRVAALLALSELPASERAARAIADVVMAPQNARDPWVPEAAAIAGVKQDAGLLVELLGRRLAAQDTAYVVGVRRTVDMMTRYFAARENVDVIVPALLAVPEAHPMVGEAVLVALGGAAPPPEGQQGPRGPTAQAGWPEGSTPSLTAEQRTALAEAALASPPEMQEAFARVGAAWGMPDLFPPPA